MSLAGLYSPPEQAGYLLKKGHSRHSWKERYFILKGSHLFFFPDRKDPLKASKLHGFIPLEGAKIETELPPSMADSNRREGHIITITLHSSFAFSAHHPFWVLCAPSPEVQMAWVNAMWQAAIPRADLIHHLSTAGKLADVLASYAKNVQECFPVADATVLSSGGRARTTPVSNVGTLAGMVRRHKSPAALSDLASLPLVTSDKPAAANVLARTESGNLTSAPSSSVRPTPASGASVTASSAGAAKPSSAGGAATPTSGGKPTPAAVAVTATAGVAATAGTAVAKKSSADKEAAAVKMQEIQEQIARLEKEAGAGVGEESSLREQSLLQQQGEPAAALKMLSAAGAHAAAAQQRWRDNPLAASGGSSGSECDGTPVRG